jgi:rhodanese-related sulfurtransferase
VSLGRQILFLLGLALLPAIGQAIYFGNAAAQEPPMDSALVSVEQAQSWGDKALWVDARVDEQFEAGHVPGAVQLNEDRWDELLHPMLGVWSPEKKVVVYCSRLTCHASHEVAERLRKEAKLTNVYVLDGGWEEWQKRHK